MTDGINWVAKHTSLHSMEHDVTGMNCSCTKVRAKVSKHLPVITPKIILNQCQVCSGVIEWLGVSSRRPPPDPWTYLRWGGGRDGFVFVFFSSSTGRQKCPGGPESKY